MADARLVAMVDGYAAARARLEERIQRAVTAEFARFDGWYSQRQVAAVTAAVAAQVSAGQMGAAQLTDAYLARVSSYVTARSIVGATVPSVMGRTLRNGVKDHQQVYARVAAEFRFQRSKGLDTGDALGLALVRAQEMVSTDMGLATQHQTARFTRRRQITRYRRVIRPELSASGTCGLCVAASDRTYFRGDLLPIHARCKCVVIPITANTDPGSQLNEDTLEELYSAAGAAAGFPDRPSLHRDPRKSTYGQDLKRVRYVVVDHGELGPQLRLAKHGFRGPAEVAAA